MIKKREKTIQLPSNPLKPEPQHTNSSPQNQTIHEEKTSKPKKINTL